MMMTKRMGGSHDKYKHRALAIIPIVLVLLSACQAAYSWTLPLPNLRKRLNVRGYNEKYGLVNNSTIPDPMEVATIVGVKPCTEAPKQVWKIAWRTHGAILPILHLGDKAKPRDSKQSLKVLWCKAIASMDKTSKVYDERWTYDTLPSPSRWLLRLFPARLFPRLHHANIEVRTAYLDKVIHQEIEQIPHNTTIRLISVGGGYDIRCSRLLSRYRSQRPMEAYELDLENVAQSKQLILDRLSRRRPDTRHPTLIPIDLNQVDGTVKDVLAKIVKSDGPTHTIYISEGVLIYLKKGVPSRLLKLFRDTVVNSNERNTASFCFADRLENVPAGNLDAAKVELGTGGWKLLDFCPKPGLARHMGVARLKK